jgi:hypothetical protein
LHYRKDFAASVKELLGEAQARRLWRYALSPEEPYMMNAKPPREDIVHLEASERCILDLSFGLDLRADLES